jgi:hypothetical protein
MRDLVEQAPSERDEEIYSAWEGGKKTLRGLARQFSVSVTEIGRAIDRCLPVFNSQTQMRAYKREIQKLEDVGTHYYAKAMEGEIESAHVYARINERYCAMQGWSSVNVRLDPYAAQVKEEPSGYEKIRDAIMRIKYGPQWQPSDSFDANGNLLSRPLVPPTDDQNGDQNRSKSESFATPTDRERNKDAT